MPSIAHRVLERKETSCLSIFESYEIFRHSSAMNPGRRPSDDSRAGKSAPRGWRSEFGERWTELALGRARAAGRADGEPALAWAVKALTRSGASLEDLISGDRRATAADQVECLSRGAEALEACAAVWEELAPVAGQRQVRLVRCLERRLKREEAEVLSGQADYALGWITVRAALTHALEPIERLREESGDRAQALEDLERAAVSLAAIAVRAWLNVKVTGTARGADPPLPASVRSDLLALAGEIARKARELDTERRARDGEPSGGRWLSEALVMRLPAAATREGRDPTLRAESLLLLRSCWLRLGALQFGLLEALDEERGAAVEGGEALHTQLAKGAAKLLRRARLESRPSAFDFARAWEHQLAGLGHVVADYCRGLGGEADGFEAARACILAALVRVTAALWLIDAQLGDRPPAKEPLKASGERRAERPRTHCQHLARRVKDGGSGALDAALELLEQSEPATFSEAVRLVSTDGMPPGAAFDAIADAWEHYDLVRHLPWD